MQQFATRQQPGPDKNARAQKVVITAIILFALSGLMMGFAVGAFTRPHRQASTPSRPQTPIVQQKPPTATPAATQTTDITALGISCPIINTSIAQTADGTTSYQLSATLNDKSFNKSTLCGSGKLLTVAGITCKMWITNDADAAKNLTKDQFFPVSNLQNPFPKEIPNAFIFSSGQQVQACSPTGTTTWTYKLSPTLKSGTYYLGVAADWQGLTWNWRWSQIIVKGR